MLQEDADFSIDAVGLKCPEPLMIVRNRMRTMQVGQTVFIEATDPSTVRDFTNLCRFMGHELLDQQEREDRFLFLLRKGPARKDRER